MQDLVLRLKYNRYISFDVIYTKNSGGVFRVDGYLYIDKRYGMFRVSSASEGISTIKLYNGEYSIFK